MKKLLLAIALLFALTTSSFAAGTCVEGTVVDYPSVREVSFVCTADASAATYPSTLFSPSAMSKILGWYLMTGSCLNGATGPTASTAFTLSTTRESDILGGAGKSPTVTTAGVASKFTPITDTVYATSGLVPITDNLTLASTGNAVNSAIVTLVFKFVK